MGHLLKLKYAFGTLECAYFSFNKSVPFLALIEIKRIKVCMPCVIWVATIVCEKMPYTLVPSAEIDSSSQLDILSSPCQSNRCGMASPSFSHKVGRVLSFFPSRRHWDSSPPTAAGECVPHPLVGGRHTRLQERGWGSPNSDEGTYTVVLCMYMYLVPPAKQGQPSSLQFSAFAPSVSFGRRGWWWGVCAEVCQWIKCTLCG